MKYFMKGILSKISVKVAITAGIIICCLSAMVLIVVGYSSNYSTTVRVNTENCNSALQAFDLKRQGIVKVVEVYTNDRLQHGMQYVYDGDTYTITQTWYVYDIEPIKYIYEAYTDRTL
jgi:hypothetical protein